MAVGQFTKGVSGNPGGRPKGYKEIAELARTHGPDAIATLVKIMKDSSQPGPTRVSAAAVLLERGFGKAIQPIDGDGDGGPVKLVVQWLPVAT